MPTSIFDDAEIAEDVTGEERLNRSATVRFDIIIDDEDNSIENATDNFNNIQEDPASEIPVQPTKQQSDEFNDSYKSTTFQPEHFSAASGCTKRNIKQHEYIKHGSHIKTLLSVACVP
jgi:hypothetical protein